MGHRYRGSTSIGVGGRGAFRRFLGVRRRGILSLPWLGARRVGLLIMMGTMHVGGQTETGEGLQRRGGGPVL